MPVYRDAADVAQVMGLLIRGRRSNQANHPSAHLPTGLGLTTSNASVQSMALVTGGLRYVLLECDSLLHDNMWSCLPW